MESQNDEKNLIFYFSAEGKNSPNPVNLMHHIQSAADNLGLGKNSFGFKEFGGDYVVDFNGDLEDGSYRKISAFCDYIFSGNDLPMPKNVYAEGNKWDLVTSALEKNIAYLSADVSKHSENKVNPFAKTFGSSFNGRKIAENHLEYEISQLCSEIYAE